MAVLSKPLHEITAIAAGKDQTLALLSSGLVLGWGGAGSGRVTSPYIDVCRSGTDKDERAVFLSGPARFSRISAGYGVSLGVSEQRQALIWGFCQVAVGGKARFSEEPTVVEGVSDVSKVAAGQFQYAAIDQEGQVHTWGIATDGALGRQSTQINSAPGLVTVPAVKDIAIGDGYMVALSADGRLYGWGSNSAGQLGTSNLNGLLIPALISTESRIRTIASGATHLLAITTEGMVVGWGSNHFGQVGFGPKDRVEDRKYISKPVQIKFREEIVAVAAGTHYSVALGRSGRVYAWGWNGYGQLGQGDLLSRGFPTQVPGLSGIREIAAGDAHVLALRDNELLGWGCNDSGQLAKAAGRQTTPTAFWTTL